MLLNLGIDKRLLPPHDTRKRPGGYIINPDYLDAIESIHGIHTGRTGEKQATEPREPNRRTNAGQLDLETTEVKLIKRHLLLHTKMTRDGLLKSRITREIQLREATTRMGQQLPKITKERQKKNALWKKTTGMLEQNIKKQRLQRDSTDGGAVHT